MGDGGTGPGVNQRLVAAKLGGISVYQIQSLLLRPPQMSYSFNLAEQPLSYLLHGVVIWDQVEVKSCVCSTELLEDEHQGVHRE